MKVFKHSILSEEKEMKNTIIIIVCSFLCLAVADPSFANVSVLGGLTREMNLKPGDKFEGVIHIRNNGEDASHVNIFQTDYIFAADGQTMYGEPGSIIRSNAKWLTFGPTRIMIPAKETIQLYYEINVPINVDLKGTYWSVLMVEPDLGSDMPGIEEQKGKVVIGVQALIRYAVQIITNIGETGESNVKLIDNKLINLDGKTILQADIENIGDRYLSPSVWMELYDKDGLYVDRFDSDRQRIYPTCSVRYNLDLTDVPAGLYTVQLIIDNGDERVFGTNYEVRLR
jgi:hypothetical protein